MLILGKKPAAPPIKNKIFKFPNSENEGTERVSKPNETFHRYKILLCCLAHIVKHDKSEAGKEESLVREGL